MLAVYIVGAAVGICVTQDVASKFINRFVKS